VTREGDAFTTLQGLVDSRLSPEQQERTLLDAGCGSALPIAVPEGVRLVGLDISPEALALNERLDAKIVGDVQTYPLPARSYDVVVCWTVLEHVRDPGAAVANLAQSLKPGGMLVIGVPNIWSLKGLATKLTPHRFHIWAYRRFFRFPQAGTPGYGPYRTYLRREIAPERLARVAHENGLDSLYETTYNPSARMPSPLNAVWSIALTLCRIGTLGRWHADASEYVAVFRRRTAY
jgi:2-polyprenyl-3-methyl-5-hydroxy-6-metoxy-1,4-benzoquinol methylase